MPVRPTSAEQSLIQRHFAPLAKAAGALKLRDDAAVLTPPAGCDLVLTTDAVVAGVHFFPDDAPADIAAKALRVNLSDLAAKGADPLGALMALCLPGDIGEDWVAAFATGLGADLGAYGIDLLGGDTVRAPMLSVAITAIGSVPHGRMVRRSAASAGDALFVTGTIGDAALGLLCRTGALAEDAHLLDRYLRPQPRSAIAGVLRQHASAAMDISDGLAGDLDALLAASGCTGSVAVETVPLSKSAARVVALDADRWETILTGGDDYEILATVPPARCAAFTEATHAAGVTVTRVGTVETGGTPARFVQTDGSDFALSSRAYSHL